MWFQALLFPVLLQCAVSLQAGTSNEARVQIEILKDNANEDDCSPSQFTYACNNGRCVTALFLRCNLRDDCGDNSDEKNCDSNTCSSWQFRCDSGQCIPASWKCDLRQNCRDNSDERNCTRATSETPSAPTPTSVSECSSNRILNESDRGQGYMQVVKCDRNLPKAWYRILGGAGTQMPDTCVHEQQCGTHAPGWLSGGHPTVAQGIVRRQVCFHWYSNCCQWSLNIRVRNCSAFYVYELIPTHGCSLRYCGDRKQAPTPAPAWRKYSQLTHWCTGSGRSLITRERNKMDAADCQRRCETSRPGCKAVEFWENELQKSYYYCFQCTDTSKITRYTNTDDTAYPVYVWIKAPTQAPVWRKYSQLTYWCTHSGRSLISADRNEPINAADCIWRCEAKRPGCKAVEFWEKHSYLCFECTDTSKITRYTNTNDAAYPVYVWIKGG